VGRVVFGKNAEPEKWFRLDTLLQDIAAHRPSDPSVGPGSSAIDPQNSVSDRSGVVALSSHPDIFQTVTAASASSQGGSVAAPHDVTFIDPSMSNNAAGDRRHAAENLSVFARSLSRRAS
jgi:hypothetical protein